MVPRLTFHEAAQTGTTSYRRLEMDHGTGCSTGRFPTRAWGGDAVAPPEDYLSGRLPAAENSDRSET